MNTKTLKKQIVIKNYQKNMTILDFKTLKKIVLDSILHSDCIAFKDLPNSINDFKLDIRVAVNKNS